MDQYFHHLILAYLIIFIASFVLLNPLDFIAIPFLFVKIMNFSNYITPYESQNIIEQIFIISKI